MNKAPILFAILFSLFTLQLHAQIYGCTDSEAENFNESATINDGSCQYIIDTIAPNSSAMLSNTISETSGLIMWNKQLWTHNDSNGDAILYAIDSVNGRSEERRVGKSVELGGRLVCRKKNVDKYSC